MDQKVIINISKKHKMEEVQQLMPYYIYIILFRAI